MSEPVWLLKSAVIAVHGRMIAEFGGTAGIRDEGLLDSALARPINLYSYESVDICSLSAAVDGNKRIGFIAAYMFLNRNGVELTADEASATAMTMALAASEINETSYARWIREHR